ncbi:MAG: diphosphomevalonate decarboxylase [Bacteroidetes bacterium]|nr:MAG: diphosphomevalonate decarboxylase [Bacteroidota bacterium]
MNFILNSSKEILPFKKENKVSWRSPSNIALIKYWGKKENQIPANPSLSFTLSESFTETSITYLESEQKESLVLKFKFEGKENFQFQHKIETFLQKITKYFPFLNKLQLKIESHNSFPHSAGIASSASSMSALALCLCSIEKKHFGTLTDENDFFTKASFIARLGSGSASRSVFPFAASWGEIIENSISSDEFASVLPFDLHQKFKNYKDAVLIVSKQPKKVSSTAGHELMHGHPFAAERFSMAKNNLKELLSALKSGDEDVFIEIVENEALTLHALMMSSNPGFILMHPNTLKVIDKIREFRENTGMKICFTLDAGPNIHLLYSDNDQDEMNKFIKNELEEYCEDKFWIADGLGNGPIEIS